MADTDSDTIDVEQLRQRRKEDVQEYEMDMTPMVDVTFLLLIFFMITAAFALQKSLQVPPVDSDQTAATQTVDDLEKDSIVVRVDGDNVYWIGCPMWADEQRAPSITDMWAKVRDAREGDGHGKGPAKMLVQANGDATHERVVAALDAGSAVGMEDIRLMTYEDGDL
jgi:biopolymer transport protein ExbD